MLKTLITTEPQQWSPFLHSPGNLLTTEIAEVTEEVWMSKSLFSQKKPTKKIKQLLFMLPNSL